MNASVLRCSCYRAIQFALLFVAASLHASPWLENNDAYLRSDLQLLADAGLVTVPVNTFPMAWREIALQLQSAELTHASNAVQQAYAHIKFKLNAVQQGRGTDSVRFAGAANGLPRSFAQHHDADWGVFANREKLLRRAAIRASANYVHYHDKDAAQLNADNSYLALTSGASNLFLSAQSQWWSPAWTRSLGAEQRVHPVYELGVSRVFLHLPLLGSARINGGYNRLRSGDDWQYASRSRLSLRPHAALELSTSYFDFRDPKRKDVARSAHQWSIDTRLGLQSLLAVPVGLYAQKIMHAVNLDSTQQGTFDIAAGSGGAVQGELLLGADFSTLVGGKQSRLALEYIETAEVPGQWQRFALAAYMQLSNGRAWEMQLREQRGMQRQKQASLHYRWLVARGMWSLSFVSANRGSDKNRFAASWEYRY